MIDQWKLSDFSPGEGVIDEAFGETFDDAGWMDITVPGDVHTALVRHGRIADPFIDRNEDAARWVEDREWWYRTRFEGPETRAGSDERIELVFHGVDTFATFWLNGREIARSTNMFRAVAIDITDVVHVGALNTLAVKLAPPLAEVAGFEEPGFSFFESGRAHMRKAQYGYGWDWGPRLPGFGLWKSVELFRHSGASLTGTRFRTHSLVDRCRRAVVSIEVESRLIAAAGELEAEIELLAPHSGTPTRARISLTQTNEIAVGSFASVIDEPELWWTHELGAPALYTLNVRLLLDGVEVDRISERVGIRTIELDQSPDPEEPGANFFRFVLNGVPIFAKGANWIPADSFPGGLNADRYARLIAAAQQANMTMLRVWGGGIYEHDVFYDLCDEAGILVWQDFMFACSSYPEDRPEFVEDVRAEAIDQVRRLRNHPSLALWCGNNENQLIQDYLRRDRSALSVPGALYYDHVLPSVVAEHDGETPYWPGSPFGGDDHNSATSGDRHSWQVWHGIDAARRFGDAIEKTFTPDGVSYRNYAHDDARFVSEFGIHAAPVRETLRRVIPADQMHHHSPAIDHHNKDTPKDKGDTLLEGVTGLPVDLDEYIDFSMIAQAEGLKFGIEHYRRRMPHCSGTLIWQLNDCWPTLSWSIIDYHGFPKAGYHFVARAYAPVLASFVENDSGEIELWATNDTAAAISDEVTVRTATFTGETVHEEAIPFSVGPGSSRRVALFPASLAAPNRYMIVRSGVDAFLPNRHFFSEIKDLVRTPSRPVMSVEKTPEGELLVHLSSPDGYAYFVHVQHSDERVTFADNFFDLERGETRTIAVRGDGFTPSAEDIQLAWC